MIKYLILFIFLSCAHKPKPAADYQDEFVTVRTALDQARSSYILGCVEAYKSVKIQAVYAHCKEKALLHQKDIQFIMEQTPQEVSE